MDSLRNLSETRKRKRDTGYSDFETAQRQQRRDFDPTSSLFFSDSEEDDRSTTTGRGRFDTKNVSTSSKMNNSTGSNHTLTQKHGQVSSKDDIVPAASSAPYKSTTPTKHIKEECVEEQIWTGSPKSPNAVIIYVGKRNAQLSGKREDLTKSAILNSWIVDDAQQGTYIMRPQLLRLDLSDFEAVLQYIHSGEYAPMLMESAENPGGPKILDGLKTTADYARELVRSGRIYVIAQDLQVEGMAGQIYRKITEVDATKYNNQSLVELASIIFKNDRLAAPSPLSSTPSSEATEGADEQGTSIQKEDRLEKWIVGQLAKNFREIMRTAQSLFWRMERETSRKCLFAQVLEEVTRQYRDNGTLPVADLIELE